MDKEKKIRIGCASAFWGDTSTAAKQLVQKGNIDYLVFDFLAEVTMSILAAAKMKNLEMGYATDFVEQLKPLFKQIKEKKIKVISNAGGINLDACRLELIRQAEKVDVKLNIAVIKGDNLLNQLNQFEESGISEMESKKPIPNSCLSINAYLGTAGIVAALGKGADIIITGRCVDSALVLAPLMHEFNWADTDYDLLANGSLAGHIIECGAQCTGGNFTDWQQVKGFDDMGFPIVEVNPKGEFIVSKPNDTGGMVTFGTVAEQFLYEIGNPSEYILPDVVCDFSHVSIQDLGNNKVFVKGAKGFPPTNKYKVSATYMNGYRIIGTLVIGGMHAKRKGKLIAKAIIKKTRCILKENGFDDFTNTSYDFLGTDSIYGPNYSRNNTKEIVLRLIATHYEKNALIILSREMAQASTGMAAGVINFLGGRPKVSPSIHLFSFLLPKDQVSVKVNLNDRTHKIMIANSGKYYSKNKNIYSKILHDIEETKTSVPLIKIAFARSGDKGDHANIGVISRKPEYLPYIQSALTSESVGKYFNHVLKGTVERWDVPGINGINFVLKNSLGGGGMASLNIDPQGKAYAQQLLEYEIPVTKKIANEVND